LLEIILNAIGKEIERDWGNFFENHVLKCIAIQVGVNVGDILEHLTEDDSSVDEEEVRLRDNG